MSLVLMSNRWLGLQSVISLACATVEAMSMESQTPTQNILVSQMVSKQPNLAKPQSPQSKRVRTSQSYLEDLRRNSA